MKILEYPETRQTFNFDCGANALVSTLVFCGIEEREDRVAALARTTKAGTSTEGILRVMDYYGLPHAARERMQPVDLRNAVDEGHPTLVTLQAYRESNQPYRGLWQDGHWTVAIGYDEHRIFFEDPSAFHRTWLADEELRQRWHDVNHGKRIFSWGCTVEVAGQYHHDQHFHME